jgi:hypothetical protein
MYYRYLCPVSSTLFFWGDPSWALLAFVAKHVDMTRRCRWKDDLGKSNVLKFVKTILRDSFQITVTLKYSEIFIETI